MAGIEWYIMMCLASSFQSQRLTYAQYVPPPRAAVRCTFLCTSWAQWRGEEHPESGGARSGTTRRPWSGHLELWGTGTQEDQLSQSEVMCARSR